jgi:hypothetical protein
MFLAICLEAVFKAPLERDSIAFGVARGIESSVAGQALKGRNNL